MPGLRTDNTPQFNMRTLWGRFNIHNLNKFNLNKLEKNKMNRLSPTHTPKLISAKLYFNKLDSKLSELICSRLFFMQRLGKFIPLFFMVERLSDLTIGDSLIFQIKDMFYLDDLKTNLDRKGIANFINYFPQVQAVRLFNLIMRYDLLIKFERIE